MRRAYTAGWVLAAALVVPGTALAQLTIQGQVRTEDGRPLPENMRVSLLGDMFQQGPVVVIDPSGRFRFDVPSRVYNIQVDTAGSDYEMQTIRFEPKPNPYSKTGRETQIVDIVLRLREEVRRQRGTPVPGTPSGISGQPVPPKAREAYDKAFRSLEKKDSETAVKELQKALEIFPEYYDALEALGAEYVNQKRYEESIHLLQQAIGLNEGGWRSHYALGVALAETKQRDAALKELRRSVVLNPQSVNANMRLGLELANDPARQQEAIQAFEKVAGISGNDVPDVFFYLASLYSKQQKYAEAADALEKYAAAVPNADPAQKAQYEKAVKQLRQKAAK